MQRVFVGLTVGLAVGLAVDDLRRQCRGNIRSGIMANTSATARATGTTIANAVAAPWQVERRLTCGGKTRVVTACYDSGHGTWPGMPRLAVATALASRENAQQCASVTNL